MHYAHRCWWSLWARVGGCQKSEWLAAFALLLLAWHSLNLVSSMRFCSRTVFAASMNLAQQNWIASLLSHIWQVVNNIYISHIADFCWVHECILRYHSAGLSLSTTAVCATLEVTPGYVKVWSITNSLLILLLLLVTWILTSTYLLPPATSLLFPKR